MRLSYLSHHCYLLGNEELELEVESNNDVQFRGLHWHLGLGAVIS